MKLILPLLKSTYLVLLFSFLNIQINAQTPVAYYPFNGNANDAIGTNHGTANGATLTTDRFGNANSAYSFDGKSSFIERANVATTQTDNYTMSAWMKPSILPQIGGIVLNGFENTVNTGNGYSIVGGKHKIDTKKDNKFRYKIM